MKRSVFKTLQENLRYAYKCAKKEGIILGFENGDPRDPNKTFLLKFNATLRQMRKIKGAVRDLRITLDIGHLVLSSNYYGDFTPEEYVDEFTDLIVHAHVHGNRGKADGFGTLSIDYGDQHLPLKLGSSKCREVIRYLVSKGFRGPFTIEQKAERVTNKLSKMLDFLESSIKLLEEDINSV